MFKEKVAEENSQPFVWNLVRSLTFWAEGLSSYLDSENLF